MRTARLTELLAGDAEQAVSLLRGLLVHSGRAEHAGVAAALDALVTALAGDRVGYERRSDLYAAAIARGELEVARLLFDVEPTDAEIATLEATLEGARPVVPRGKPLSLGERKSLARGRRNDVLIHLIRDPHPQVVAVLLGNPHLVESDVLAIAARRPTLPRTQELIAESDRWRPRSRVRRALVFNPFSPPGLALRLLPTLGNLDLRRARADANLAAGVRRQARGLLELRAWPPKSDAADLEETDRACT